MANRDRLYIDVVKGITIFLMLWGHCIQCCAAGSFDFFENVIFKWIYSFHMPLFMLISGYLFFYSFQKRDLKQLTVHRTQSMLQPIVLASMLNCVLIKLPNLLVHGSMWILDGELLNGLYSFWFLWCVLSSSLAVGTACKATEKLWLQILGIILGIYFISMFPSMQMHLFMYPYFVIGFFFAKYKKKITAGAYKIKYLSIIAFPVMMLFYERKHYIYITPVYNGEMGLRDIVMINGFRWAVGLVGCVFVLTILEAVFKLLGSRKKTPAVLGWLAALGQNSLSIYCLSVSLLSWYLPRIYNKLIVDHFGNVFADNWIVYNLILTPMITIMYCIGLYGIVCVLKKYKIHQVIFGR